MAWAKGRLWKLLWGKEKGRTRGGKGEGLFREKAITTKNGGERWRPPALSLLFLSHFLFLFFSFSGFLPHLLAETFPTFPVSTL
jgi:hypothetical protein